MNILDELVVMIELVNIKPLLENVSSRENKNRFAMIDSLSVLSSVCDGKFDAFSKLLQGQ